MVTATGFILWFLRYSNAYALTTPWGAIYCVPGQEGNVPLLNHELQHIEQIKRDGPVMWTLKIFYYLIRYGYENSPYEKEAREVSGYR